MTDDPTKSKRKLPANDGSTKEGNTSHYLVPFFCLTTTTIHRLPSLSTSRHPPTKPDRYTRSRDQSYTSNPQFHRPIPRYSTSPAAAAADAAAAPASPPSPRVPFARSMWRGPWWRTTRLGRCRCRHGRARPRAWCWC